MKTNKKIQVGMFIDVYYPMIDGVLKVLENQINELKDRADFHLIVPASARKYVYPTIGEKTFYTTKSMKVFFLDYRAPLPMLDRKLKKYLNTLDLDIVIAHSPFAVGTYGLKWAKKKGIPSISFAHSQIKAEFMLQTKSKFITRLLMRRILRSFYLATEVVAVGEGIRRVYNEEYKLKRDLIVINNATDLKLFEDEAQLAKLRKRHGLKDELVLEFLGRISKIKGIYLIADALKIVKDNGVKFKMFFIGDGLELKNFMKYVDKLGLSNEVIFLGVLQERHCIAAYLRLADLFLFPSIHDASSLVQQEAASQKTPVLFSEGSATSFGYRDGIDCFFAPFEAEAYAQKIIELANDREKLYDIRESVYKNVYRTWEKSAREVYDLSLKLIAENKQK